MTVQPGSTSERIPAWRRFLCHDGLVVGGIAVCLLVGYRFLFILPNVLLADWGDRAGDAAAGLHTLSASWTERTLRVVASALLSAALLGAAIGVVGGGVSPLLLIDAGGSALMLAAVWHLRPDTHRATHRAHALVADLIVAWPATTAAVAAWG